LALFDADSEAEHQAAAVKHLEAALGHWRDYAAVYIRQYRQPLLYNRVGIVDIHKLTEQAAATSLDNKATSIANLHGAVDGADTSTDAANRRPAFRRRQTNVTSTSELLA